MPQNKVENKCARFFGARIDLLTMDETVCRITELVEKRDPVQHAVINVAKLVYMQDDKELEDAVNSCALVNADGMGIIWGARLMGIRIPERVTGIDLMEKLIALSEKKGFSVYFLGATREVMKEVVRKYLKEYPGLRVAGFRDGYFPDEGEEKVALEIKRSGADMLFVGMPSPKKEKFLKRNLGTMGVPFAMGVGGSFDIIARKIKRAPLWMQKTGLEWCFRLVQEPGRLWKRYMVTNFKFLKMLVLAGIGRKG